MNKKLIIIGAGVSGLTCGIFAQKEGFETTILEKKSFCRRKFDRLVQTRLLY